MLFNSLAFAIFLPIVFILYWGVPHRFRYLILLVASYYFYMSWNPKYVLLILLTTAVSYGCGIMVERVMKRSEAECNALKAGANSGDAEAILKSAKKTAKLYIVLALVICLGVLFFFKYFNFMSESFCSLLSMFAIPMSPITLNLLLPVGISFYTFQSLSYVIDVYRQEVGAQKNFLKYALFISFFPQLVAGPIERTKNLMPQLFEERKFDEEKAVLGLRLMLIGFLKKLVISDVLARYVDMIFDNAQYYFGMTLIMATVMFTFQIYCDFSGYSDIAIGCAKLLNVDLMTNFKSPYNAKSIKEFWGRWHISLSTWFRDYVYIPLGGNRVSKLRHSFNTFFTMLVSGLWHGANWTFVLWGGLHGVYQIVEGFLKKGALGKIFAADFANKDGIGAKILSKVYGFGQALVTFVLVSFAWIFFRANTMQDAAYVVTHLHNGLLHFSDACFKMMCDMGLDAGKLTKISLAVFVLLVYDYFSQKHDLLKAFGRLNVVVRWIVYVAVVAFVITIKLHGGTTQSFIYFQF